MKYNKSRSKSPNYMICSIFKNILFWLVKIDWLIDCKEYCFLIFCKSIFTLKVCSIPYILRKNNKKIPSNKLNVTKNKLFFLSQTPTYHSFTFNLWFLYELMHKVHRFSKSLRGIYIFNSVLFFIKVYIFVQEKVWTIN